MDIVKNQQYSVGVRFRRKGSPAAFNNPPRWGIFNAADEELLTGTATNDGDSWYATFTIPNRYVVPGGKEQLVLQFSGFDTRNKEYLVDRDLTLIDNNEDFKPNGLVYSAITQTPAKDSLVLPEDTAEVVYTVADPNGEKVLGPIVLSNLEADSANSGGYEYNFTIDLALTQNRFLDPYQVVYEYESGGISDVEIHPLYILDSRTLRVVNVLKSFLDKARLIEIDTSLQWYLPELIQAVLQGVKFINASEPEGTFWTTKDFPPTLDRYLELAATAFALEMRQVAEGMNTFDFQGLNTTLNYNRSEFISTKLSEINAALERLPTAKKSAINISGKGTPGPGQMDMRKRNLGALQLSTNALNNRIGYNGWHRRFYV